LLRQCQGMGEHLALIGFGEAGSTFASSAQWHEAACAFDIDPGRKPAMTEAGVLVAADAESMLAGARIVLSLVTASEALSVAQEYGPYIDAGTIWCDMNSVAPETKAEAAEIIEQSGGRYVDVAILAPVHPGRMATPLLISGKAAQDALVELTARKFTNVRVVGDEVGKASAIKMIRSIMVKGIEALTDEMMAAASAAGVVGEVLASLDASEKSESWRARAAYNLERMMMHGERRAAEMEEAISMLRTLGVEPVMTEGTVRRQRGAAARSNPKKDAA